MADEEERGLAKTMIGTLTKEDLSLYREEEFLGTPR